MQYPAPPLPPQPIISYATAIDARDADHLRLLSIFHYVYGGVVALFSCVFIIHIVLGIAFLNGSMNPPPVATTTGAPAPARPSAPPPEIGWVFIGMGSGLMLLGWTLATMTIISGRCITRRRARTFSLIVAGFNGLSVPLGTTLGVFTFMILMRDSVARLYAMSASGNPPGGVASPRG